MLHVRALRSRGFKVWLNGGRVCVFPRHRLNDALRTEIAESRKLLVQELTAEEMAQPRPHFNASGDLVIPFNSPGRYHWWVGGQSVEDTLRELGRN